MATTKHTCGGPAFGRRTAGCPRCDELAAGAAPVRWASAARAERDAAFARTTAAPAGAAPFARLATGRPPQPAGDAPMSLPARILLTLAALAIAAAALPRLIDAYLDDLDTHATATARSVLDHPDCTVRP